MAADLPKLQDLVFFQVLYWVSGSIDTPVRFRLQPA